MVLARLLVFLLTFAGGLAILRYTEPIVRTFGMQFDWADKVFGAGGTYTAVKLFALLLMFFGFLYLIGQVDLSPPPVFEGR
ncbi:hypothetical protein HY375_00600 [Candidatus Berkelbacteria bacterium]|nr:hypothetical protein [Candidatus Berkelbacteria bacterium]